MLKRLYWLGFLLALGLLLTSAAGAQSSLYAIVKDLQLESFPSIALILKAHDANGNFIHGLQASDVQISEDGQPVQITDFTEARPGVMLTVVLDPGEPFTIRNSQGFSRYDLILESLVDWSQTRIGSTIDDLSLTVNNGPERTHLANPFDLFYTLSDYQIDEKTATPGLDVLFRGVEISSDPAPRPGMERDVLFITSPISGDQSFNIQNLLSQAKQKDVHIFIWFVTAQSDFDVTTAYYFTQLADETGGAFMIFSGGEALPSLETYLEPQRSIYQLKYQSEIKSGGEHQVAAQLTHKGLTIGSNLQTFSVDLQPPNPAFIFPQLKIQRKPASAGESDATGSDANLQPSSLPLSILIDFPDGRVRDIVHSALYVDGKLSAENSQAPYDKFIWNLSNYGQSGQHVLRVEVTDNLGLTGKTIDTPVVIEVDQPVTAYLTNIPRYLPLIAALLGTVALAVAGYLLILGGKIQPRSPFGRRKRRRKDERRVDAYPLSETEQAEGSKPRGPGWLQRWQWSEHPVAPRASAYLTRIAAEEENYPSGAIPIVSQALTIGRDPGQASLVLDDLAIDPLHARLEHRDDGTYRIMDEGSIAGTWVNYDPVTRTGVILEHADLIHFGKIGFYFTLREPPQLSKPVIIFEKDA
jgi:hypothetical protein